MKGFIEVEYKGCGRIGSGYDKENGKVLININAIELVDSARNMICLKDRGEIIYYCYSCTYEEIKEKIKQAQGVK